MNPHHLFKPLANYPLLFWCLYAMNKRFTEWGYTLKNIRSSIKAIIVYHYVMVGIIVIIGGSIVAAILMGILFLKSPSSDELSTVRPHRVLSTEVIDELELWMENRQNDASAGL